MQDGDICNIDVTVYHREYHGDLNETLFVGNVSDKAKDLVKNTWECLDKAIAMVKPGVKYRDVGNEIQKHASSGGFSVVRSYCGHGIHKLFHCAPNVPHYAKNKGKMDFYQTLVKSVFPYSETHDFSFLFFSSCWCNEAGPCFHNRTYDFSGCLDRSNMAR